MKKINYLILFLILSANSYSQIDTSGLTDFKSLNSKSEIISKYRSLLMDNIIDNNYVKTKKLFNYIINNLDNDYYIALYPTEKWMVGLWLKDFAFITSNVINLDSGQVSKFQTRVKPQEDQLSRIVYQKIVYASEDISNDVRSSPTLSKEDKEFLLLILRTYLPFKSKDYQDNLNEIASKFINDYPKSKFENYIKNYVRYKYSAQGFFFGMELYSGAMILTSRTSSACNSGGTLGVGMTFGSGALHFNTRFSFAFSRLKNDIVYNTYTWTAGNRAQVFLPELSIEYKLRLGKKVSITPLAGLAWFSISPYENDQEKNSALKNLEVDSKAAPIFGLDLGWDFMQKYYYNEYYRRLMFAFSSVNFRYIIQPISFQTNYNYMNGYSHNISISYKFGMGRAKRIL